MCVPHVQHDKSSANYLFVTTQCKTSPSGSHTSFLRTMTWHTYAKIMIFLAAKFALYRQDEESMLFNHDKVNSTFVEFSVEKLHVL